MERLGGRCKFIKGVWDEYFNLKELLGMVLSWKVEKFGLIEVKFIKVKNYYRNIKWRDEEKNWGKKNFF